MTIDKVELHAMGFRAIAELGSEYLGEQRLAQVLEELGATRAQFTDSTAWFSLEFAESLLSRLTALTGEPNFVEVAAQRMLSPRHLGPLYPFYRAFGSPALTYTRVLISQRTNKTGHFTATRLGSQKVRLTWTNHEATREHEPHMCRLRLRQFQLLPTLFGLAEAVVTQTQCALRGDPACVYEIGWQERPARILSASGIVGGIALACGWSWAAHLPIEQAGAFAILAALAGWTTGRMLELKRIAGDRSQDLVEHERALTQIAQVNERRYAELLEAKSEVDLKVEQRTQELKTATAKLSESFREIQALDRAKTDFFNNVSHELRSPLTLILAPLEELVAGRSPPGGEHNAYQAMRRNATRLLRLINQLLDLAKIDAGEMKITAVPTDIGALLAALVAGFDGAAKQKGVQLELRLPSTMPPLIVDPTWIESAVTNLLANALRLTPAGKAVQVSAADSGADATITVTDQGPGIALEDQARVFERFAQGDSAQRVIGGTGIGLALVREAARLHGGSVALDSQLGSGAAFTLILPRRSEAIASSKTPAEMPQHRATMLIDEFEPQSKGSERPAPTRNAPFAFVVEDNPELREFIADVLASRYRVKSFGFAKEAVTAAKTLKPDVIVSDVAMPEMNGFELCRVLRASHEMRSIPIVLVTARTDVSSILEGFDAGASDYVLKPFHGRELLARVDVHVRLRRMVQELALRERHTMLGVLAASVAHQVRNPLTTLVSGLPAMRARLVGNLAPSTFELIDMMIDCAGRIERLTNDLMDLSHVDRESRTAFRPSDGLRAAVRLIKARLGPEVTLEATVEDCPPIEGRGGDMNHVFMNLLDNAIRAVESSGTVRVEAVPRDGYYSVRVGDSGPGINEETAKQIFEPFFTTRKAGEGTGLGLAIARQVVQQFGGVIEVSRSELGGALFSVDIPLTRHSSVPRSAGPSAS